MRKIIPANRQEFLLVVNSPLPGGASGGVAERGQAAYDAFVGSVDPNEKIYPAAILNLVQREMGYAGKPTIKTPEELNRMKESGEVEIFYRGDEKPEYTEQWKRGELYTGVGMFGNGTYASNSKLDAIEYGGTRENQILTIGFPRTAKVGDHETLKTKMRERYGEINKQLPEMRKELEAKGMSRVQSERRLYLTALPYSDVGLYAALQGYDAIRVQRTGESRFSDYLVILNRSVCFVGESNEPNS